MTIPPFALDFGHIITSVTDTALLLNNDQQRNIEMIIQSALNDFLTESSLIGGATYTTASITSVKYTTTTFLPQSTDTKLQQTFCLTSQDCATQREILGGIKSVEGDYPFKGCFRRKDNLDGTVIFGLGGSVEEMMDVVLNDNLERVFCYKRVDEEEGEDDELVRRSLGDNQVNDSGGEVHTSRRRLSVQSAKFTVIVTGGQVVYNSGQRPTESELRDNILAQIGANEGSALAAKVRSLASSDPTVATLLGDLDTVGIAEDQPSFVAGNLLSETFQSVTGCPRNDDVPTTECLAKEQTSGLAVHCCSGTLGTDLRCKRPNCRFMDNYADAEAHCDSKGMRLCTAPELNSNACCDKGCGFNFKMTWTSSVCSAGDDPTLSPSSPPITSIEMETMSPTPPPTTSPPTREPSTSPTSSPSSNPTSAPTRKPSMSPTFSPTRKPSASPTFSPTGKPSNSPSNSPVTMPITSTPTTGPSNSPIVTVITSTPTVGPSNSPIATLITSTPTVPPTAAATTLPPSGQNANPCPDGLCLDLNGQCRGEVRCFMDSCDANPCNEGEVCTPNYCGGCDRICSALAINPSPTTPPPTSASPETPRPTYMFGFPTPPPLMSEAPTASPSMSPMWPTYGPTADPDPSLPTASINGVQSGPDSDGNDDGNNLDTNNTMIIAFASAGSLVIALAIGLGFFAMRKHKNHRRFEDKDPSALETTFNQSDCEEDIEEYNYDENANFYPASHVEIKYNDYDKKKSSRFGLGSTFGSALGGGKNNGGKGGKKHDVSKNGKPLSCQDGNGMNAAPIDDVVDDLALEFLAGTGNSKKSKETKSVRDFRPKLLSGVAPFKAFQGEETEDDDSNEFSKSIDQEGSTAPDFRPKLMDTSSEFLRGEDIDESSGQSSILADPNGIRAAELAFNQDAGRKKEELADSPHRHDPDGHLILSDIYKAAKKSRWEREEKSQISAPSRQVSAPTQTLNDKVAKDLRVHRAKMNSFLDEDTEPELGRGATSSSKIFNPLSLPQRQRIPRILEDDDSDVLKDFSFAHSVDDNDSKEPRQSKKKFAAPPRFAKRNKGTKKSLQNDAKTSPDRRFFTFDGDNDESDENEDKSRIPNLIMADDKSGFASAVSSIGQVDWRGRERTDRRVRVERKKKQREPSVDTIETNDAEAQLVACQSTLHKTKNILTETLERSLHCKARVVSPASAVNDDDDEDDYGDQVARPWKAKFITKGKDPPVVEDAGYQSSNYDPDSDWDVDDNDLTVDYSAEGSFMPSPLKGVGFDLRR
eukprot:scaffold14087_cov97-Skeletonema_dohrnii-CCMP3373.AAC.2